MKKFYLHNGKEQQGPFDIDDLKNRGITRKTKIWYEGQADWSNADSCEELKEIFNLTTPPHLKTAKSLGKNLIRLGTLFGLVLLDLLF